MRGVKKMKDLLQIQSELKACEGGGNEDDF